MGIQLRLGAETFTTGNTWERLVTGVDSHMSSQCPLLQELLSAQGARMWNATMQFAVVHQLEFTRERSPTVRAHERIQRAVETRMHHQMLLLGETFSAIFAHVRTLASMELAVRYQMPLQRERSAAFLAHERSLPAVYSRVGQQVMLQREALFTLLALVGAIGGVQQQMGV